eukprot:GGOE01054837.1.p1 GENE.GGOE01054837.1~~GGOE01054837.1.p1  ORF type:complete len:186 (+),score=36.29 GGOE01054837.1:74-631(+)
MRSAVLRGMRLGVAHRSHPELWASTFSSKHAYPDQPRVGVSVCVIRRPTAHSTDPEVLLVQRGKQPAMGSWSLPGGSLELGEALVACGAREVREETGLEADIWGPFTAVDAIYMETGESRPQFHYVVVELLGFADGVPVAQDDAADAVWLPRSRLADLHPVTPLLASVVDRAVALLRGGLAECPH